MPHHVCIFIHEKAGAPHSIAPLLYFEFRWPIQPRHKPVRSIRQTVALATTMKKSATAAAALATTLAGLALLPCTALAQSTPTCAGEGVRAQDCGAQNPMHPVSCCDGYQCVQNGGKRCVAVSGTKEDRPSTADAIADTKSSAQCGVDANPSGTKCDDGMCCSAQGVCGYTDECAEGCQSGPCDVPPADPSIPKKYKPPKDSVPKTVEVADLSPLDAETYSLLTGCGDHEDDLVSRQYAAVMLDMHRGMAIKFTGNDEFDFLAGMIPHHSAAVDMCSVYYHATHKDGSGNPGIESLCYNITYGPADGLGYGAQYQSDFSQVGETQQMMDILEQLGKVSHYEKGCSALSDDEKRQMALQIDDAIRGDDGSANSAADADGNVGMASDHPAAAWWSAMDHKEMFMGCGKLDIPSTLDYLSSGMKMHMRMAFEWTGDNDVDFLLGMAAHHEGAIEMCNIYYKYWSCAPARMVCTDPLPLDEVQRLMSNHEEVSTLNAMHHICSGHILATQPKELLWMRHELKNLNPQALADYDAQIGSDGEFLIEKLACSSKYLNAKPATSGETDATNDDNDEQCAVDGQKARSCGASSHKYKSDCCPGLWCSSDKYCVAPSTADDTEVDEELVPETAPEDPKDFGTSIKNDVTSNSKQAKSTGGSGGGLSGVAIFFIVAVTLGAVLLVAAVIIRRKGVASKGQVPPHLDPNVNLSPAKTTGDDGEMEEVYMI